MAVSVMREKRMLPRNTIFVKMYFDYDKIDQFEIFPKAATQVNPIADIYIVIDEVTYP